MQGEPAAEQAGVLLQQPEAHRVFSLGNLSLDHGTLAVAGCTGSQGPVDSDWCLHTGFLVAAAAVLLFHAHLWCPR